MEKVCRSCLKVDKLMRNIFEEAVERLPKMIKDCTAIRVMPNDGLPDSLCSECVEKLTSAFEFREFFRNNDQALRAHLNVTVKVDQDEELNSLEDVDDIMIDNENDGNEEHEGDSEFEETLKYKCDMCTRSFNSPRALNLHKTKMHDAEDPDFDPELMIQKNKSYKCSHCDMKFSRQHLLMKHQREMHLEISLQENNEIKTELPDEDEEDDDDDDEDFEEEETEDDDDSVKQGSKKEYPCDFCNKVLRTPLGLKIHRKKHTGKNLYDCDECDKSFSKCRHMKNHKKVAHGAGTGGQDGKQVTKREMQCEFCNRKFKYKKSFTQHMTVEHGIDVDEDELIVQPIVKRKRKKLVDKDKDESDTDSESNDEKNSPECRKCPICNTEFAHSHSLSKHLSMHRDVLTHKCDKCSDAFLTETALQAHLARHEDKPYNCFACRKAFSRGEQFIHHVKTHDPPDAGTSLDCPICHEAHADIPGLSEHVKIHLSSDKKHKCKTCGKSFTRRDNFKTHVRTHKSDTQVPKLHLCIYCGKEFNNSSNMIVHMRRHTGERPYKCKQCGKGFPRSHDLKCHERTHSGEKPYLCTLCGKSFNKSNKLLRHTRVHTGERPYVCSICGRAFTQSNDLALHMRRHTGARPYACGVCPARFIQSGQLKAHQRSKGHWVETAPDLKGSYRVEPVISTGESKPIRFRRTASGHKYEPPDFSDKPPPLLEQQQQVHNEQSQRQPLQQTSQLQTILTQEHEIPETKKLIIPVIHASAASNVLLVQAQSSQTQEMSQTVHIEYTHPQHGQVYDEYGKVQTETIVVPVHSHTPTSTTGTFQEETVACSESSNAFSPADASYECRSYS